MRFFERGQRIVFVGALLILTLVAGYISIETNDAAVEGGSYASMLYRLHNSDAGDTAADGKLLEALKIQSELGEYKLITSEEPNVLQLDFQTEPEDRSDLDAAMEERSMLLLALIDDLHTVRWCTPGDAPVTTDFDRPLADRLAGSLGYADVRELGQSAEGIRALLDNSGGDFLKNSAATVSTLRAMARDADVPLSDSFGGCAQFAYDFAPEVRTYGLEVVTYSHGTATARDRGAIGTVGDPGWDRSGQFWLSWELEGETGWNGIRWTLYGNREQSNAVSFDTGGFGDGTEKYFAYDYDILGGTEDKTFSLGCNSTTPIFAFYAAADRRPTAVSCEDLADQARLEKCIDEQDLAVVVYLSLSTGDGTVTEAPVVGGEPFADILGYSGVRRIQTLNGVWAQWTYYARAEDGTLTPIAESFGFLNELNRNQPEDYSVDLDGDGQKELVCNVCFGADGHQEAYVYQRRADGIYLGSLTLDGLPDFNNWGVNASWSAYDPKENAFWTHYDVKGRDVGAALKTTGLERMVFEKYGP